MGVSVLSALLSGAMGALTYSIEKPSQMSPELQVFFHLDSQLSELESRVQENPFLLAKYQEGYNSLYQLKENMLLANPSLPQKIEAFSQLQMNYENRHFEGFVVSLGSGGLSLVCGAVALACYLDKRKEDREKKLAVS